MKKTALVAAIALAVGCLFPDVSSLDGDGGADAGAPEGGDASALPGIANAGHVSTATGNATQTHVVWAIGAKRWWLFYVDDDPSTLKTRSSADFATWTDGPSLTLGHPNGGEGRNFTVAYASLGGSDVIHVSFSHAGDGGPLIHSHTRGVISGSTIQWGLPVDIAQIAKPADGPDGPASFIDVDGTVWDATGFVASAGTNGNGYENQDVFVAAAKDDGVSWTTSFTQTTIEVVDTAVRSRIFLDTGGLGATWSGGEHDPNPLNLHFSLFSGSWQSAYSIFDQDAAQDANDWDAARYVTPTSVVEGHVVRARLDGVYEHAWGTGGSGQNGAAPPTQSRIAGTGVVLLADPMHLAAFDVAGTGELVTSRWDGAAWSAWSTVAPSAPRSLLSGYCPDLSAHPEAGGCAILWTSPWNGGFVVDGVLVQTH